jgi:magnesium chelatase family protein
MEEKPPQVDLESVLLVGELGLDGSLRPVKGAISYAIAAVRNGFQSIVVSSANLPELAVLRRFELPHLSQLKVIGFDHLKEVLEWLWTNAASAGRMLADSSTAVAGVDPKISNFDDMVLTGEQELAAQVAAAGLHSMLLRGVPGTGKSMFAQRLISILPSMEKRQHLEALCIHNTVTERIDPALLAGIPPFRAPHHQSSTSAIIGSVEMPGELSLAHGGILFLDEFPEFRRDMVEALREPLETGTVQVSRVHGKVSWYAHATLVAAANDCPCGWHGSKVRRCTCASTAVIAYRNRLSGPILERIDMHVNFVERRLSGDEFLRQITGAGATGRTARMRQKVLTARDRARLRNRAFACQVNRELRAPDLLKASGLKDDEFSKLVKAVIPPTASNRNLVKALRVARTIADLREESAIDLADLHQAWSWQSEIHALQGTSL